MRLEEKQKDTSRMESEGDTTLEWLERPLRETDN